jgi:hypothetical protein
LQEWATAKDEKGELIHKEFSLAYAQAKQLQESVLVEGAISGLYNAQFSSFAAKNLIGWKDKSETELTGKDGGAIETKADLTLSPSDAYMRMLKKK